MIVGWVAQIHNKIMELNDSYSYNFTDKQLHFLVMGVVGLLLVFVVHPLFLWLAKRKRVMAITWIYVFTLMVVITFAIEIGQKITNTGNMEFADIVFGLVGFMVMFGIFELIRLLVYLFRHLIKNEKRTERGEDRS
jgi:hypothetical protein